MTTNDISIFSTMDKAQEDVGERMFAEFLRKLAIDYGIFSHPAYSESGYYIYRINNESYIKYLVDTDLVELHYVVGKYTDKKHSTSQFAYTLPNECAE